MKLCSVHDLKGGEILAKAIMTEEFRVLLYEETQLRPEYISKIKELGISEVYIKEDALVHAQAVVLLKEEIEVTFTEKVKAILEKHTYSKNQELKELCQTADSIITNILEEDEVVENIYDIRERSSDIYEHSISSCSLATLTALRLGLSREEVHDISVGCLLHDIGLRYLTIEYRNQNLSDLTKLELSEYRKHPVYGYVALKDENWITETSKNIILYHHEYLDGSGYPLKAKDIPFSARIVTICDSFDEMICGIGCKRLKVYEAVEYLKNFRGIRFDTKVTDVFLEFTAVYPVGSEVLLSDNSIGRVLRQNKEFPDRPVVQIIKGSDGNIQDSDSIIDLVKVHHLFIEKVVV